MERYFYSNGKLLLTGEYVVLDGARCLAVPTAYGQSLAVEKGDTGKLSWTSKDEKGHTWFSYTFDIKADIDLADHNAHRKDGTIQRLTELLRVAKEMNPGFLNSTEGFTVTAKLGFPRDWGLGSSSTLVSNLAAWACIDPFELLWRTFTGSGYDIACARHSSPILYKVEQKGPEVIPVLFDPPFKRNLFFVHLNQKQDSREGIRRYKNRSTNEKAIWEISKITDRLLVCREQEEFESLLVRHEQIIASLVELPTVKEKLFPDFPGAMKSLGAWGGDFIMVASHNHPGTYFKGKGYNTVIPYTDMVIHPEKSSGNPEN
ncbi:GYDIA family GHMP kinase [Sinomicrobium sp. M5D2P17]